jgi:hypothetical protein
MRVLKILLIIFSSLILLGISYGAWEEFSVEKPMTIPMIARIIIVLMIILSIINILYHIKTFRFYRREEKRNLDKKISKILVIGTLCFPVFLLFLVGVSLYNNADKYWANNYSGEDVFFLSLLIFPAFLGFLEVSILKKRIKRLKIEYATKDEINDIGNEIF